MFPFPPAPGRPAQLCSQPNHPRPPRLLAASALLRLFAGSSCSSFSSLLALCTAQQPPRTAGKHREEMMLFWLLFYLFCVGSSVRLNSNGVVEMNDILLNGECFSLGMASHSQEIPFSWKWLKCKHKLTTSLRRVGQSQENSHPPVCLAENQALLLSVDSAMRFDTSALVQCAMHILSIQVGKVFARRSTLFFLVISTPRSFNSIVSWNRHSSMDQLFLIPSNGSFGNRDSRTVVFNVLWVPSRRGLEPERTTTQNLHCSKQYNMFTKILL